MTTPRALPTPLQGLSALADAAAEQCMRLPLPTWLRQEGLQRLVLFLNHVLQQEPMAMSRLARLQGQNIHLQWQLFQLALVVTPAGLFDLGHHDATPDLRIELMSQRPSEVMQAWMAGEKPAVSIHGDVRTAAEINWLIDHVRWDVEGDLSRLLGDAPAYWSVRTLKHIAQTLRQFVRSGPVQEPA